MAAFETTQFGWLEFQPSDPYHFPEGLPGFEECRSFLLLAQLEFRPLMFLQSLDYAGLRFVCAPVRILDPDYSLSLSEHDLNALGFGPTADPVGLVCLAILTLTEGRSPTANLSAPVVISPEKRTGIQSIQSRPAALEHPVPGVCRPVECGPC